MSIQAIAQVLDLEDERLDAGMKLVLIGIANHTSTSGQCFPSVSTLMRYSALAERTVRGIVKKLEEYGFIRVDRREGRSSIYYLTLPTPANPADTPAAAAPTPATDAPPPLQQLHPNRNTNRKESDASDARAAFDEDWKPKAETVTRIVNDEGLSFEELERERQQFVLKCVANDRIPKNPDAAFRAFCKQLAGLHHKPKPPPPRRAAPVPMGERQRLEAAITSTEKTIEIYRSMGRTYEIEHELAPRIRAWTAELEELPNDDTGTAEDVSKPEDTPGEG